MTDLDDLRRRIRSATLTDEDALLAGLRQGSRLDADFRARAATDGAALVRRIRSDAAPGMMEVFLAEYGLSTDEGVALMCLAEALLRVPDAPTIDALIEDKIAPSEWGRHLGHSSSSLVNASTWGLMLTGKVLTDGTGMAGVLRAMVRRLGEPVIRVAVQRAMREMGQQFVLGETISDALDRGRAARAKGYTFSYDMLGEAALTAADAADYFDAYAGAIAHLAKARSGTDIRRNPGISVKLSALHPRYEQSQRDRVMAELVPRLADLAGRARRAGMGFNIDAEEADRLDLSLDVIQAVLRRPDLAGWDGFGVVVQAYGKRATAVIDWLHALAVRLDRRIMVRLVKGAYWDSEIKRAQMDGLTGFPVFTRKAATDVHYLLCAERLLGLTDRIYPQ
ncbi:MAG: proline dehydrogenase family protein, partial [Rhodobacteraceae bacterium]|nr:proline dehydrogenase family protein [Paracoccaceae bacterium]